MLEKGNMNLLNRWLLRGSLIVIISIIITFFVLSTEQSAKSNSLNYDASYKVSQYHNIRYTNQLNDTNTVRVQITKATDTGAKQVAKAMDYWESQMKIDFQPTVSYPELVIIFVSSLDNCGQPNQFSIGCAPVLDIRKATRTHFVYIERLPNNTDLQLETIKHEFGHILNYDHSDTEAYNFMES